MGSGRLIRVRRHQSDPEPLIYVVAESDPQKALVLLQVALSRPLNELEDLGRVNDDLIATLKLKPGQHGRI